MTVHTLNILQRKCTCKISLVTSVPVVTYNIITSIMYPYKTTSKYMIGNNINTMNMHREIIQRQIWCKCVMEIGTCTHQIINIIYISHNQTHRKKYKSISSDKSIEWNLFLIKYLLSKPQVDIKYKGLGIINWLRHKYIE